MQLGDVLDRGDCEIGMCCFFKNLGINGLGSHDSHVDIRRNPDAP